MTTPEQATAFAEAITGLTVAALEVEVGERTPGELRDQVATTCAEWGAVLVATVLARNLADAMVGGGLAEGPGPERRRRRRAQRALRSYSAARIELLRRSRTVGRLTGAP